MGDRGAGGGGGGEHVGGRRGGTMRAGAGEVAAGVHERVFTAPLILQAQRGDVRLAAGGTVGIDQGTQGAAHHLDFAQSVGIFGNRGLGDPDVPAPEDLAGGILRGDQGVARLEGLGRGEGDVVAVEAHLGDDGIGLGRGRGVLGLPDDGDRGGCDGFTAVTLHGPEHIVAGGGDDVAVGGAVLAQVLGSGLGGLLADGDGLDGLVGTGLDNLHGARADLRLQVLIHAQLDDISLGAGLDEVDPVGLGLHLEGEVRHGIDDQGAAFRLDQVVDVVLRIGGSVRDFKGLALEGELHDGGEAGLGVGIDEDLALGAGALRRDDDLLGEDLRLQVVAGERIHDGLLRAVLDGVGNIDGIGRRHDVVRLLDDELERGRERNGDGAVVIGDDDGILGHFQALDDAVLDRNGPVVTLVALDVAEVDRLASDGHVEVPVLADGEGRLLIDRDVRAVFLEDDAVDGPAELTGAVLHHGKDGTCARVDRLDGEVDHFAGGVGDGDAGGAAGRRIHELLHLLDELAFAQGGLDAGHIDLQIVEPSFDGVDFGLEAGIVIGLGATQHQERQCNAC